MTNRESTSGRASKFLTSVKSYFSKLTWNDLNPIEERLALAQVAKSGLFFIAPLMMIASVAITWQLFPTERETDSAGLFYGTASIVLMAWALLLASRAKILELAFGGFDRLYVWHRWAGIASVVFLYLHTMSENDVGAAILPFGETAEELGEDLASTAQTLLITLIIISILRILPYRIWRFSHIGLIVPFTFSAFHSLTAERPNSLFEETGWWLWSWTLIGIVAFMYRVLIVDSGIFDKSVKVQSVLHTEDSVQLDLVRKSKSKKEFGKPSQFVFLRVGGLWREAHPFSLVKFTETTNLITVLIRRVGDWSIKELGSVKSGDSLKVSKPLGHLSLSSKGKESVWFAGGSGITPFLQSESYFKALPSKPHLTYFYRGEASAFGLDHLRNLDSLGYLALHEVDTSSKTGAKRELSTQNLNSKSHVVVCGPRQLVVDCMRLARKNKAKSMSFEIYDYRSPFGPNLNPLLKMLLVFVLPAKLSARLHWLFDKTLADSKTPKV